MRLSSHALTMLLKAYRAVLTRSAKYLLIALPALVAENSLANQQLPPPPNRHLQA